MDHVNSTRPQIQFSIGEDRNNLLGFLKCNNNLHRLWVQDIRRLETNLHRAITGLKFPSCIEYEESNRETSKTSGKNKWRPRDLPTENDHHQATS